MSAVVNARSRSRLVRIGYSGLRFIDTRTWSQPLVEYSHSGGRSHSSLGWRYRPRRDRPVQQAEGPTPDQNSALEQLVSRGALTGDQAWTVRAALWPPD